MKRLLTISHLSLIAGIVLLMPQKAFAKAVDIGDISAGEVSPYIPSDPNMGINYYIRQLESILSNTIGFLTILAGLFFLVYFIVAGITWITAGGDAKKAEDARSRMTNGVIGLVIVVASYSIVFIIGQVLGIDVLNLGSAIIRIGPSSPNQ